MEHNNSKGIAVKTENISKAGYIFNRESSHWECSGLMEPDTLIRDNNNQLLRCQNGTETNIQTIF